MARGKKWMTGIALLACLAMVGAVWAQTLPGHDLSWRVLSGGGRDASSDNYAVRGTLGQLAIGSGQSANHFLGAGYWYGVSGSFWYEVYLPVVTRKPGP